jgi:succinyl-diaminopimelate desuccinylase
LSVLLETTAWLVGIPSETGSEATIRDAIADRLNVFPQTSVADSLVVGEPGEDNVLLVGHLDTVPLQGELGPVIDGDRLLGLGASDMKAGLAVMIHLVEALGTDRVCGVFYAGEEGAMDGNQLTTILETIPAVTEATAAIVLEPTDLEVQAGCNGSLNAIVGFEGTAAHSARPWLGDNAVSKAGPFLGRLHTLEPEDHVIDGLTFREVISVTTARGGVANNIIPSRFEMNVNYRFAPDRTVEEAIDHLRAVCIDADTFAITDVAAPGLVELGHPVFESLAAASAAEVTGKQGWTDVAQLSQAGIPAVNFGPGETSLAHKPGESVRISDLGWAYDALLAVLA